MFILKAKTKKEVVYFMNVMMITQQKENAKVFDTLEDAEEHKEYFNKLFYYEEPIIEIEQL